MTTQEAKFILSAFRPNGGDASDPAFGDALHAAAGDPVLGEWFARSRAHDAAVAEKLGQVAVPAGLREAILAGARVSSRPRSFGVGAAWAAGLAAAAALAFVVASMRAPARPDATSAAFARFAINDVANGKHGGTGEPSGALIASLQAGGSPMPGADRIDFDKLKETGCRTLSFAGHDVIEVCFLRDGALFHLYVFRNDGPAGDSSEKGPSFIAQAAGAAAVWSDTRFDYAVATSAGTEALRRLF
jgi:hypothetical protein